MDDRIGHFLHFLSAEKGGSDNTIAAYRNDLTQFHAFLSTLDLKQRRYAEATVARKVAAVKSFFQFLQAEGAIKHNPTESLKSPRVGKALPKPLTVQQMDELLEQPAKRKTPEALRDLAMIEVLYATGLR